jgi:hypothetical protein
MEDSIGILDVIAMLGLFVTAFVMWVAWELITGRKALALFLAAGAFGVTWLVARAVGAHSPLLLLGVEVVVAILLVRVANGAKAKSPH